MPVLAQAEAVTASSSDARAVKAFMSTPVRGCDGVCPTIMRPTRSRPGQTRPGRSAPVRIGLPPAPAPRIIPPSHGPAPERSGRVAKLVEQGIENHRVGGSIPSPATMQQRLKHPTRSEERRDGKECICTWRTGGARDIVNKKKQKEKQNTN